MATGHYAPSCICEDGLLFGMMENDGKSKSDETVTFQYIHTCTYSSLQEGSAVNSQASGNNDPPICNT